MNIFVAKLNYQTSSDSLREAFEGFGEVSSAKVIFDKFTERSKGYGFVEMPNDDEGYEAINSLNQTVLDGNTIVVKKARPRGEGGDDGGYNRGGGGGYNRGGGGGYNRGGGGGYRDGGGYGGGGYGGGGDSYGNDDYNSGYDKGGGSNPYTRGNDDGGGYGDYGDYNKE